MTTRLYTHDACLEHDTGPGHPERSDRLRAVRAALGADDFAGIERAEAPAARAEDLARCHPDGYVEQIFELAPSDHAIRLDPDTVMSPDSLEASLRAAGAVIAGIDAVVGGEVENAFCATRPPGHHAEPGRPMGFCIFNSVVVGALHARAAHGVQRIAVVDFDVHHGNGTEAAFREDGDLAYVSSHQYPYYPGTGAATDTGVGNIHNAPLPAGSGSAEFRVAYADRLLPALDAFAPELVLEPIQERIARVFSVFQRDRVYFRPATDPWKTPPAGSDRRFRRPCSRRDPSTSSLLPRRGVGVAACAALAGVRMGAYRRLGRGGTAP